MRLPVSVCNTAARLQFLSLGLLQYIYLSTFADLKCDLDL